MTTALEGGEWSAARPGRTLPRGKTRYPLYRRLGGPQALSGRTENLALPGFDLRTVQPVAQSLYRLSYPAHLFVTNNCEIMVQWQSAIHSLKLHRTSSLRWGSGANLALAIKIKIPNPSDKTPHNLHYWELWIEMIWRLVTNTLYKALS